MAGILAVGCLAGACATSGVPGAASSAPEASVAPTAVEPQVIELSVTDHTFSTDQLEADAGRPIVIAFSNHDPYVHNVQLWRDDSREDKLFFGELLDGPASIDYELGALEPGMYRFECAPHAGTMIGHLVVSDPES